MHLYESITCKEAFKDLDVPTFLLLSKDDPTYK